MIESFPLHWPIGFPRHTGRYLDSQFKATLGQARDGLLAEIKRLGGSQVIVSTNIPLKRDGQFYASAKTVDGDEGVAVYFMYKGSQVVLACDQYRTIRENVRAVEKSIEAMRGLERWGCSDILNRTFQGFKALPEQASPPNWWDVIDCLSFDTEDTIKSCYRKLAKKYHPDAIGGSQAKFIELQQAYDEALKQFQS